MKMLFILFLGGLTFAQDSLSQEKFQRIQQLVEGDQGVVAQSVENVSVWSLLVQLFLGLSVVGVLMYVAIRLLKHLQSKTGGPSATGEFKVLQTFFLSPAQKIQKVVIYDKIYLLGVTNENIQVLDVLGSADELDIPQNARTFSSNVDAYLSRFKRNGNASFENAKEGE